jgi:hypothetical protein
MTASHARARQVMVASLIDDIPASDAAWLDTHLRDCASCSNLRQDLGTGLRALRLPEMTADAGLVEATQRRLHDRARELNRERALHAPLLAASLLGLLTGVLTAVGMARALAAIGTDAGVPSPLLAAAGVALWFLPAILVAAAALVAGWRPNADALEAES